MQEIELMQYHSSTCYKKFQRDMEKKKKQDSGNDVQTSSTVDAGNNEHHRKRLKTNHMKQVNLGQKSWNDKRFFVQYQ